MNIPNDRKYIASHEWMQEKDGKVVVGLTDFAQDALGDIVFVNLPEVGDTVTAETSFGDVESVKAVSDIISPVSGVIGEVNEKLLDAPEMINQDAYSAWIARVTDVSGTDDLLSAGEYEDFLKKEA